MEKETTVNDVLRELLEALRELHKSMDFEAKMLESLNKGIENLIQEDHA